MSDLVFEHYVPIARVVLAVGLLLLVVGMLVYSSKRRVIDCLLSSVVYLIVVALGMSANIKHLSVIGFVHAATAIGIVVIAIHTYKNRASWLLAIPIFLILVVLVFNLFNDQRGLELMGRWERP